MIKILTGRQTDPLQEKILEEAVENYQKNPEYETFIIVPNHIKFTTEVKAISKLAINQNKSEASVKNLQILSFSRLAWYFLKDAERGLATTLDDAASAMLLEKIITQHKDELALFQQTNINPGLVKDIYTTVLKIYDSNLDLDDMEEEKLDLETKNKIHDLKIIYEAFLSEIAGKFSTKNEIQLQLNELLSKMDLSKKSFYFTDFSHFSLQELLTVELLLKNARNVTLAFKTKLGDLNPDCEAGEYDYVIQQTIKRITNYLDKQNIEYATQAEDLLPNPSAKEQLNSFWTEAVPNIGNLNQVQLVKADSRYAEAYFVAHTIYQQVALRNYRYSDFLILAPNLHEYETYLTPILKQNDIPFFNDLQKEMKYHPLVILIENIANLLKHPYKTTNILSLLKTRLFIPSWYQDEASYVHDVDELENFVLAHGINHTLWKKDFSNFVDADVIKLDKMSNEIAKIEKLRAFTIDQITNLLNKIQKEKDSQKAITVFFNFLVNNGVAKQLENWRDKANEKGDLQQAQQPEQVWNLLSTLLHDYLLINPDEFDASEFFNMLTSGFREATFSQIPSTLDAVNISEMGMVQTSGYKQVFIIGATSGNLPSIQKSPSFLSSENLLQIRQDFNDDSYLEDSQELNNLDQNYQFGLSLALAEDQIYLSYPVINTSNEQLEPSIYYERLKKAGAPEFAQHDLPSTIQDTLSFITNPRASLGYLSYLESIHPSSLYKELLNLTKEKNPERTEAVIDATEFDNQPEDIGPELAQELYGQDLNSSVSQLETYYQNSYEYFLKYGLRLNKRFESELDIIQAGNYFHETFDRLVKELNERHLDLASLNDLELEKLLALARERMSEEGRYAQLMNDPFNKYLFKCLDHTTSKVAYNWRSSLKKTPFRAKYSELSFGNSEKLNGLAFSLPDLEGKHQVKLRGKIDRVDLAPINDEEIMAQVIDYKSSNKNFNLAKFYHGLSLQMVSYLDVLYQNPQFFAGQDKMALLGAFYQTVTRKLERLNKKEIITSTFDLNETKLDSKPELMYNGLINNDPDLLKKADPMLENAKTNSDLYKNIRTISSGKISFGRSKTNFNEEELELILAYDEYLIKQASSNILSGSIDLNPFKFGKTESALTYSFYRDIFFFDAMLNNQYHEISSIDKKKLLTRIKEKLGKKE